MAKAFFESKTFSLLSVTFLSILVISGVGLVLNSHQSSAAFDSDDGDICRYIDSNSGRYLDYCTQNEFCCLDGNKEGPMCYTEGKDGCKGIGFHDSSVSIATTKAIVAAKSKCRNYFANIITDKKVEIDDDGEVKVTVWMTMCKGTARDPTPNNNPGAGLPGV